MLGAAGWPSASPPNHTGGPTTVRTPSGLELRRTCRDHHRNRLARRTHLPPCGTAGSNSRHTAAPETSRSGTRRSRRPFGNLPRHTSAGWADRRRARSHRCTRSRPHSRRRRCRHTRRHKRYRDSRRSCRSLVLPRRYSPRRLCTRPSPQCTRSGRRLHSKRCHSDAPRPPRTPPCPRQRHRRIGRCRIHLHTAVRRAETDARRTRRPAARPWSCRRTNWSMRPSQCRRPNWSMRPSQ